MTVILTGSHVFNYDASCFASLDLVTFLNSSTLKFFVSMLVWGLPGWFVVVVLVWCRPFGLSLVSFLLCLNLLVSTFRLACLLLCFGLPHHALFSPIKRLVCLKESLGLMTTQLEWMTPYTLHYQQLRDFFSFEMDVNC